MFRIFVQGDRNAKGIKAQVRLLGRLCATEGIGLNVGESGEIVRILSETGASVRVHMAKNETPNVWDHDRYECINCNAATRAAVNELVVQIIGTTEHPPAVQIPIHPLAWGIRLATLIGTSDGFVFFPGSEGAMAHVVPVIAQIAKGERDKGVRVPRRVALIGWEQRKVDALVTLMDLDPRRDEWFRAFDLHKFERSALLFVMGGFQAGAPTGTKP